MHVRVLSLQEIKNLIHHVGLTKVDLILSLSPREYDLFWKSLVETCRMKYLTTAACQGTHCCCCCCAVAVYFAIRFGTYGYEFMYIFEFINFIVRS